MAERKYYNANIVYQTDTFGAWVDRTNQLVHDALTINLTAQQNSSGGITTGNVVITSNLYNFDSSTYSTTTGGHLQANVIIANTSLRGGNMTSSGLLSIDSNTNFHTDQITITSNSTQEVITTTGNQLDIRSELLSVNNTTMRVGSNVHINTTSSNVSINSTATHISGTTLDINSTTVDMDGTTLTADYDNITVTANDQSFKANSTITAIDINNDGTSTSTTVAGNTLVVDADESTFNANVTFGSDAADTVSFVADVDSNIIPAANGTQALGSTIFRWDLFADDATIDDLSVDNTLTVAGQTDLNGNVNIGNANTDTISFVGEVDTNIVPSANGSKTLGSNVDRWDLFADDATIEDVLIENRVTVGNSTVNAAISSSGNIDTDGTLTVAGATGLNSTLAVAGATTMSGRVTVGNTSVNAFITTAGNIETDGTLTVTKGTALSNTLTVAGNSTFTGARITVGNTTVNAVVYANGSIDTDGKLTVAGDITGASDIDITGESNTNTLRVRTTSAFEGNVLVGNSTVNVAIAEATGDVSATGNISGNYIGVTNDINVGNTTVGVVNTRTISVRDTLTVGNSTVNAFITSAGNIETDGTLTVAGNTSLHDGQLLVNSSAVTAVANVDVKNNGANTSDPDTQPNLIVWGDFEVKGQSILASDEALSLNTSTISSLTVTSNTELRGTIAFINATSFIVDSAVGNSTVGFVPSANGVDLGSSSKRWETYSTTIAASGNVTITSTTDANSTAGSIRTSGGVSAAKKAYIGGAATLANTLSVTGITTVTSTTQANSTAGAIKTSGGLSVAKDIYVGGDITDGTNDLRIYYANGTVAWPA